MKRGSFVGSRKAMKRGTRRVGQAAAERRKTGGKLAVGRDSATKAEWVEAVGGIRRRAHDRDEIFPELTGTDPAHIHSRGRGGDDKPWNLLWLSRMTHNLEHKPYRAGRLVYALGADITWQWRGETHSAPGSVRWAIEVRADKRSPVTAILGEGLIDLRLPGPGEGGCQTNTLSAFNDGSNSSAK